MFSRRSFLQLSAGLLIARHSKIAHANVSGPTGEAIRRAIPASGELLPVIGMGSSRTFDTDASATAMRPLREVMRLFFEAGGKVIDTSPMYGRAEERIGDVLREFDPRPPLFAATKVWTHGRQRGIDQMNTSAARIGVQRLDLIGVHNLSDWRTQLDTLKQWRDQQRVRYIGITTSHGRDHRELIEIMKHEPLDFVQFSYNIGNRDAEEYLLPLARDRGIATMINRPYQRGSLFRAVRGHELPPLAREINCASWGQFFLKFILAHPAVTCVIPATSKPKHMADNMQAGFGRLPDQDQRQAMLRLFQSL